jgi:hypothetical protein
MAVYMKETKSVEYVSNLIGDDYKSWNDESVFLDCGTGSGKTTFVIKQLSQYAESKSKKILYLCNRKKLKEHVDDLISKDDITNIDVMTYQLLESAFDKDKGMKWGLEHYEYIVADECHYFLCDATFNRCTDLSYQFVNDAKNSVVIYMSATAESLYNILKSNGTIKENRHYKISKKYSYVDNIYFYKKDELTHIIDNLLEKTNDKIVCFCNSNARVKELFIHYKEQGIANIICSQYTNDTTMKAINEKDCIKAISDDLVTFDKRLLIATKVIDNGIDLKDTKIKHIISEVFDLDSAVQCLGRKRSLNDVDKCNFYILNYEGRELHCLNYNNKQDLEPVELFLNDYEEFLSTYAKRSFESKAIYIDWQDSKKVKVNYVYYAKLLSDNENIKSIKNTSYKQVILEYLGDISQCKVSEFNYKERFEKPILEANLKAFLESHVNQNLFTDKQNELIVLCNISDKRNRLQKSIKKINDYFMDEDLHYELISKTTKDKNQKSIRYWVLKLKT